MRESYLGTLAQTTIRQGDFPPLQNVEDERLAIFCRCGLACSPTQMPKRAQVEGLLTTSLPSPYLKQLSN